MCTWHYAERTVISLVIRKGVPARMSRSSRARRFPARNKMRESHQSPCNACEATLGLSGYRALGA